MVKSPLMVVKIRKEFLGIPIPLTSHEFGLQESMVLERVSGPLGMVSYPVRTATVPISDVVKYTSYDFPNNGEGRPAAEKIASAKQTGVYIEGAITRARIRSEGFLIRDRIYHEPSLPSSARR